MNRLKKKAKRDFFCICGFSLFNCLGIAFLTHVDIKGAMGARYLAHSFGYVAVTIGIIIFLNIKQRKHHKPVFDERELYLIQRSVSWGSIAFFAYGIPALYTPFYLIGGHGKVPMWSVAIVFFGGFILTGCTQFLFLMNAIKKDEKLSEGGVA